MLGLASGSFIHAPQKQIEENVTGIYEISELAQNGVRRLLLLEVTADLGYGEAQP
jgi:hypothetical protein